MGEDESDTEGWDTKGLSSWAMSRFGVNLSQAQIRKMDAHELEEKLREAAAEQIQKRDVDGVVKFLEPPYKMKGKTGAAFEPANVEPMDQTLERFDYLQQELQARVDRAAGLALERLKLKSPFSAHVRYNLYATFCILAAHQRRHLWQAEQILV